MKLFYTSDFALDCICVEPVKSWRAEPPVRYRPESAVKLGWLLSHLEESFSLPLNKAGQFCSLFCEATDQHLSILSQSFVIHVSQERIKKTSLWEACNARAAIFWRLRKAISSMWCVFQWGQAEPLPGLGEEGVSHTSI